MYAAERHYEYLHKHMPIIEAGDYMGHNKKYYGARTEKIRSALPYLVLGWISAVVSLFVYSFVFGILGVAMGIISTKKENRAGTTLIVGSIIMMTIGLIYGGVLVTYLRLFLGV